MVTIYFTSHAIYQELKLVQSNINLLLVSFSHSLFLSIFTTRNYYAILFFFFPEIAAAYRFDFLNESVLHFILL